jgi:hypothetical protein
MKSYSQDDHSYPVKETQAIGFSEPDSLYKLYPTFSIY